MARNFLNFLAHCVLILFFCSEIDLALLLVYNIYDENRHIILVIHIFGLYNWKIYVITTKKFMIECHALLSYINVQKNLGPIFYTVIQLSKWRPSETTSNFYLFSVVWFNNFGKIQSKIYFFLRWSIRLITIGFWRSCNQTAENKQKLKNIYFYFRIYFSSILGIYLLVDLEINSETELGESADCVIQNGKKRNWKIFIQKN